MRWSLFAVLAACSGHDATVDAGVTAWSKGPPLPRPRLEPGVTALGQRLVVVGGFDTSLMAGLDITKQVDVFDPADNTWSQLPDAPVAWTHIQLAGIDNTLYLLGGLAGQQYVAHGESYALDTLSTPLVWRPIASMPPTFERGSAAVVIAPPRIYLLGGSSSTDALATNIYYDIVSDTWGTDVPSLPAKRSHPAGMRRMDGALVVAGGLSTNDSTSQAGDTWLLQVGQTQWQTKQPMPDPRGGCAYGVLQGQLVCAGGEAGTSALQAVDSYDPIEDVWTEREKMPEPRAGTQGAAIGQRLFVPGGAKQIAFEPTDSLFIFSPLDTAP